MFLYWSKYNHLFQTKKHGYLLYNSLSNRIRNLSDAEEKICIVNGQPDLNSIASSPPLYINLRDMKAIIEQREEEEVLEAIKLKRRLLQSQNAGLNLLIAPTMNCNLACTYCYVKDNNCKQDMNDQTEQELLEFIYNWPATKEHLFIEWFGGEPLLALQRMSSITQKLLAADYPVEATLSTNGYLLNEQAIDQLEALRIKAIHIPVDGTEADHNKRRPHQGSGNSYQTIINNIHTLLKKWQGKCTIRVNIDKSNIKNYPFYYEHLRTIFPQKDVFIYPGIIDDPPISGTSLQPDYQEVAELVLYMYRTYNTNPRRYFTPSDEIGDCSRNRPNNLVVDPNGDLYKCWRDLGQTELNIGSIRHKYISARQIQIMARYMVGVDPFDDPKCLSCILLPVCSGGCLQQRILKKYKENSKARYCPLMKYSLNNFLEVYYEQSRR